MKKLIILFLILILTYESPFPSIVTAQAATTLPCQAEIILLDDGNYFETTIVDTPATLPNISTLATTKSITKTKTTYYKNKNGDILWSVSINATFTYNGSTSTCISYSHSTTCPASTWKIKSVSSSKSGNSATAVAIATHTINNISNDYTKSVTISCSKNGIVS